MTAPETGLVTVNTNFRPTVPKDHMALLKPIGVVDIKVLDNYRIASEQEYISIASLVQTAVSRRAALAEGYADEKSKAHKAHAAICANEKEDTAIWTKIEAVGRKAMTSFRQEQERRKQIEAARAQREQEERDRQARAEAARIEREAQERAVALRREGDMRAAREAQERAAAQAHAIIVQAEEESALGVILPDVKPLGGPGESRPWIGEVTDIRALCAAIGSGDIPLEYVIKDEPRPLVVIDQAVLNWIAKRWQREDIGIPGARGVRDLVLRYSKKGAAPINQEREMEF